jgi:ABC-type Zn2+ transport system substrate-binding protein/surface adhesin
MQKISLILFAFVLAFSLSAQDRGDKGKEKREQANEKKEKAHEKRDQARDKKDEKGHGDKGKKGKAKEIARLERKINHLKQVAADLESKGNAEAAANVRKTIERAETKLAEKKKTLGITDADVKEAESAPEAPAGESK